LDNAAGQDEITYLASFGHWPNCGMRRQLLPFRIHVKSAPKNDTINAI
jgi:hypothetical protein